MPLIVFADERPPLTGRALDLIAHVPRRALDPAAPEDALVDAMRDADLVVSGLRPISGAAIAAGQRVLLVDDLVATGGTAEAAAELVRRSGGELVAAAFVIDLPDLGGAERLRRRGIRVHTLVAFEGH